jgi:hypothetical protein
MTAEVLLTVLAYGALVLVAWLLVAGLLALVHGQVDPRRRRARGRPGADARARGACRVRPPRPYVGLLVGLLLAAAWVAVGVLL